MPPRSPTGPTLEVGEADTSDDRPYRDPEIAIGIYAINAAGRRFNPLHIGGRVITHTDEEDPEFKNPYSFNPLHIGGRVITKHLPQR